MKKLPLAVVIIIVLIALWLGGAWYTGTRIETQIGETVERVNAAWAKNQKTIRAQTRIQQISYERGLLASHARLGITNSLSGNDPLVEIDTTFSHGPFPLAALRRGNFLPQMYQAHSEVAASAGPLKMVARAIFNGKPPLVMDVACSYGHHCTSTGSVPPIDVDLGALLKNIKLTFGGVQLQGDFDFRSDTDYKASGEIQLLPLSIAGQNFGSGQITFKSDAQSGSEMLSWTTGQCSNSANLTKTDKGVELHPVSCTSKFVAALTATRPMSLWDTSVTPEDLPNLIKTASVKLELSRPMVVDMAARMLNLTKGIDLDAARQQVGAQFDALLSSSPEAEKFIQTQGDLLLSDWQYADGKLTVNGQGNAELLEQIKQGYQAKVRAQEQEPPAAENATPPASAPDEAASGQ